MGTAAFITCPHCKKDSHVGHFDWVSLFCVHCQKEVNLNDWLISVGRAVQLRVHLTASGAGGLAVNPLQSNLFAEVSPATIGGK